MDLHTAQKQGEQLKQQNIELSSRAWSLRDRAERSSQVLDGAFCGAAEMAKAVRPTAIGRGS
jgi:hypothetical protein